MFLRNENPAYGAALDVTDAETLGRAAASEVSRFLSYRVGHAATPLVSLPALAAKLGVGAIHIKDEGHRLGLKSFKALGGSYAVIRLVLEEASRRLGRTVDIAELDSGEVLAIAKTMTFACATDGNHGRSVAQSSRIPVSAMSALRRLPVSGRR